MALELAPTDIFPEGWPAFTDPMPASALIEIPATAKYSDGPGKTWTGKGRRPSEALERGAELDDFLIQSAKARVPKARLQEIAHVAQPGITYTEAPTVRSGRAKADGRGGWRRRSKAERISTTMRY